jgi:hypothetical protein
MSLLTQGSSQVTAAAKAGMSERTARKYAHYGRAPSTAKVPHTWRTRPDPFAEVWPEVEALLQHDGGLQPKTIWMELNERHAGRFSGGGASGQPKARRCGSAVGAYEVSTEFVGETLCLIPPRSVHTWSIAATRTQCFGRSGLTSRSDTASRSERRIFGSNAQKCASPHSHLGRAHLS